MAEEIEREKHDKDCRLIFDDYDQSLRLLDLEGIAIFFTGDFFTRKEALRKERYNQSYLPLKRDNLNEDYSSFLKLDSHLLDTFDGGFVGPFWAWGAQKSSEGDINFPYLTHILLNFSEDFTEPPSLEKIIEIEKTKNKFFRVDGMYGPRLISLFGVGNERELKRPCREIWNAVRESYENILEDYQSRTGLKIIALKKENSWKELFVLLKDLAF